MDFWDVVCAVILARFITKLSDSLISLVAAAFVGNKAQERGNYRREKPIKPSRGKHYTEL